jgi:retron-type reverse transcriptase
MRGIKQGDPLSPLLFNIALDPVLTAKDIYDRGLRYSESMLKSLAFADDIAIIPKSSKEAQEMLRILEAGLTK